MLFVDLEYADDSQFSSGEVAQAALNIQQYNVLNGDNIFAVSTVSQQQVLEVKRSLEVRDRVTAAKFVSLDKQDLILQLSGNQSSFKLVDATNNPIFSIGASGAIQFAENAQSSIGRAVVKAGETEALVLNSSVTDKSRVLATPRSFVDYRIKTKKPGHGFVIELSAPAMADIDFDYWLVN
jgi:hypothetical protein